MSLNVQNVPSTEIAEQKMDCEFLLQTNTYRDETNKSWNCYILWKFHNLRIYLIISFYLQYFANLANFLQIIRQQFSTYNNINNKLDAIIMVFINNPNQFNMFRAMISPILRSLQAAPSVHYSKSCKHSLVLLRMGEIIARNKLSWLGLLINTISVASSWLFILLY